jgi:CheY-like chemotaxis protein
LTKELIKLHGGSLAVESWIAEENPEGRHGSIFTVRLPLGPDHLPVANIAENVTNDKRGGRFATGVIDEVMQWNRDQDSSLESSSETGSAAIPSGTSNGTGSTLDPSTLFFTKEDVILIVDDSKDLRTWLVSLFRPYVGKVIEASDGVQGMERATAFKPDIIISDMTMPNMDGLQFLQAVRADEELKFTPFILLTARAGESDLTTGLLTGKSFAL